MPGPTTEVLNDDFKTLRSDLHRLEVSLSADLHQVDSRVVKLGAEVGLFKWLLGLTLVTALSGVGAGIWWAAKTDTRVGALENRLGRIEEKVDRIDSRLDRVEASVGRIEAALGRLAPKVGEAGAGGP